MRLSAQISRTTTVFVLRNQAIDFLYLIGLQVHLTMKLCVLAPLIMLSCQLERATDFIEILHRSQSRSSQSRASVQNQNSERS